MNRPDGPHQKIAKLQERLSRLSQASLRNGRRCQNRLSAGAPPRMAASGPRPSTTTLGWPGGNRTSLGPTNPIGQGRQHRILVTASPTMNHCRLNVDVNLTIPEYLRAWYPSWTANFNQRNSPRLDRGLSRLSGQGSLVNPVLTHGVGVGVAQQEPAVVLHGPLADHEVLAAGVYVPQTPL